jgi:hypothetical protein
MPDFGIATIPAAISAASALAGTGASIANAASQGSNPGLQPIDQSVGQMDPNAFGYGGGMLSPEQQALSQQNQQAQQAAQAARARQQEVQQKLQAAQAAANKPPMMQTDADRQLASQLPGLMMQMQKATQEAAVLDGKAKESQAQYDQAPTLAASEANRMMGLAESADKREGVQMNLDQYNQMRGEQQNAIGLMRGAAEGTAPSAAQATLQRGLDAANQGASSLAASAQGGGGNLALAGRAAMQQQGVNAMDASQQASILRANEMAQARQAYGQQATQAQGLDLDASMRQAQLSAEQRRLNDARRLAFETGRQGIFSQNQQGNIRHQEGSASNRIGIERTNRGMQNEAFQNQQHATSAAVTAGGTMLDGWFKKKE